MVLSTTWTRSLVLLTPLVLASCSTSVVTGKKKLLGFISVPFTGSDDVVTTDKMALIESMAPFQYAAVIMVVGGALVWWFTKGMTGLGKFMVGLGLGLSLWGAIVPEVAGWIGLIAVLSIIGGIIYAIFHVVTNKSKGEENGHKQED
jgi:hypothetical protein